MAILHTNDCYNKYEMKMELNDEIFILYFFSAMHGIEHKNGTILIETEWKPTRDGLNERWWLMLRHFSCWFISPFELDETEEEAKGMPVHK